MWGRASLHLQRGGGRRQMCSSAKHQAGVVSFTGLSVHVRVCVYVPPWSALTCGDMCPIRQPRGTTRYADLSPARLHFI